MEKKKDKGEEIGGIRSNKKRDYLGCVRKEVKINSKFELRRYYR